METMEEHKSKEEQLQQRINILITLLLVFAVALCLYVTVQVLSHGYVNLGGFMMFRVVTGSMEPTIPVGALLLTRETDIESIVMDDIVCFRTQETAIWGKIVTHRVVGIFEQNGGILLETKGDANLVADGYFVNAGNFVGKVVWHTGDGSVLANILSLFTNKIGFLGCIVIPALVLAGLILKDSVTSIQRELQLVLYEMEHPRPEPEPETDPLCGMTQEEYNEMYQRIYAELMEELMQFAQQVQMEAGTQAQSPGQQGSSALPE